MLKTQKNNRGFAVQDFEDHYGKKCSLKKSSLATNDCVWLGIDNPKVQRFYPYEGGWVDETPTPTDRPGPHGEQTVLIESHMHLTRNMVKDLLPSLIYFAETGELPK